MSKIHLFKGVDFSFKIALFFCHSAAHPIPLQPLMMPIGEKSELCVKISQKTWEYRIHLDD